MKAVISTLVSVIMFISVAKADWYIGFEAGPRYTTTGGRSSQETPVKLSRITGLGFDVFLATDIGSYFRVSLGMAYIQRGWVGDYTFLGVALHNEATYNYIDIPVGWHWYFLGTDADRVIQPQLFLALVPGFFVDGRSVGNADNSKFEEDVKREETESFHVTMRLGAGIDFQASQLILLGLNAAYEPGLTNIAKANDLDITFNSITVSGTIKVRL